MKKSLFLLPLLAGLALVGCGKDDKGGNNNNAGGNGGNGGGGGGGSSAPTKVLKKVSTIKQDNTDYDEETITFSNGDYSVVVSGTSGSNTVATAYGKGNDNQAFRIYKGFTVTLTAPVEFAGFKVSGFIGHYQDGDTSYCLEECEGAEVEVNGLVSVATLDEETTSFSFEAHQQLRLDYFTFLTY